MNFSQMKNTHIIAELAWGHDGNIEQAIQLMTEAKHAGANSFSVHITDLPDYMVPHYGSGEGKVSAGREHLEVYKYLEDINISISDWVHLKNESIKIGIQLCVMPNDLASLAFTDKEINPDYYVVSAACFVEEDFLREVARKGKKTLFRVGGAYLGEIERAINIFKEEGNGQIILLHGFQNYPTKLEETDIAILQTLKSLFNVEVGLADHIDGGEQIAKIVPILALPFGATYIEKHITLDRDQKSEDFESALDPKGFKEFVDYVRATEIAIGTPDFKDLSEATIRYRNVSRKRIVASQDLQKGEVLTSDNITYKRCDIGLTPDSTKIILGRKLNTDVSNNEAITNDKLL
jgi:sialic acid synthase SpsE